MTIDWHSFTPWGSLAGGMLIGLAASLLLWLNGRIAGISGILGTLLHLPKGDWAWRAAFIGGIMAAAWVLPVVGMPVVAQVDASWALVLIAGFLVGIGTRYASGCTSGHGVCGLSRLSVRSLAATGTFMATGFATVFVLRHIVGA